HEMYTLSLHDALPICYFVKRLLNCTASDFEQMSKDQLLQSIEASEGRTMLAEVIVQASPLYPGLTNAEYVAAFGADLVLLNQFKDRKSTRLNSSHVKI